MQSPVFTWLAGLLLLAVQVQPILAQQYAGRPIAKGATLPAVAGSEVAYFNIKDANGQNTTLVNYFSLPQSTGQRQDPAQVQRLVIILTGSNRDAWNYFSNVRDAIPNAAGILPAVSQESVAIMAPWWANTADLPSGANDTLVWSGTGWAGGDTNVFPAAQKSVSSFDCLDQILQYFDNKAIYPNLKHLVVAGHSRGAQMVHRYAAVGKVLTLTSPVTYWAGNPNSLLWFNAQRPIAPGTCTIYNNWREGLDGYTNAYENAFVASGAPNVFARYTSRNVGLARGLNDHGNANDDCKPVSQGADRGERFYNFITAFPPDSGDTVDYVAGIGHDAANMMKDQSGSYRLFVDNFTGSGSKHADFGARQVPGDDPHPVST